MKQDPPIHWCCLATESEIQYRKPGDMILYYKSGTPLKCQTGWTGRNCDACPPKFGPPGRCDQCLRGWAGENCDVCDTNFGPSGQCDSCVTGWGGEMCDSCAPGWTGSECDACEGFGFSMDSNCTRCIQNGKWTGTWGSSYSITLYMTFAGPTCTTLVSGIYQLYHITPC